MLDFLFEPESFVESGGRDASPFYAEFRLQKCLIIVGTEGSRLSRLGRHATPRSPPLPGAQLVLRRHGHPLSDRTFGQSIHPLLDTHGIVIGRSGRHGPPTAHHSAEAAQFFSNILDHAEESRHTVYWGSVGFSIRVYMPDVESFASIAYGYPPNRFQVYFAHLPFDEKQVIELRKEILALGGFKEAPKTLTLDLNPKNTQKAKKAYDLMEQRVQELSSRN